MASRAFGKRARLAACVCGAMPFLAACDDEAPARAQLLVIVDTDLPASGQLPDHPELSADAVIDSVRVDALPASGGVAWDTRTFLAPDARDWPLSFGVVLDGEARVRLRVRGFRSALASSGEGVGEATVDPWHEVTVDRLVDVAAPPDGVRQVRVVLRGDCMGVLPSFGDGTTCIDGSHLHGVAGEGIDDVAPTDDAPPTEAGTWPAARETECVGTAPEHAVCIRGGFLVLGDRAFRGLDEPLVRADGFPLHPVRVSAFYMDRTELTVGQLQTLIDDGKYLGDPPALRGAVNVESSQYCTWLGANDDTNDAYPVNCVSVEIAEAICIAAGGRLPREAEWEHAARGRGLGRVFPWGDQPPDCCMVSASRKAEGYALDRCEGEGPEPAGSHPASCDGGLGDASLDGVLDLAGSVSEVMADTFQRFDADCWAVQGVALDPVCTQGTAGNRSARGGDWQAGLVAGAAPYRKSYASFKPVAGLRCVYPAGAQ